MGMFIVLLGVFAIILTATCSAFGITLPTQSSPPEKEDENKFILRNEQEIQEEKLGLDDHGHGYY